MHEIAPTGVWRVTGMALRVTLRHCLQHAWLPLYGTLRGRRDALTGEYARDSVQRLIWRVTGVARHVTLRDFLQHVLP